MIDLRGFMNARNGYALIKVFGEVIENIAWDVQIVNVRRW